MQKFSILISFSKAAKMKNQFVSAMVLFVLFIISMLDFTVAQTGVCYGMLGDNLPPATDVVSLYKQHNIQMTRLFDPNPLALEALRGSDISVVLGIPNSDLQNIAASTANADAWAKTNIKDDLLIRYIAVGNEVKPSSEFAQYVLPAMMNIAQVVGKWDIPVSTVVDTSVLGVSYPPENGAFSPEATSYLHPIIEYLVVTKAPFVVNVYPYFAYINNKADIKLEYALFTSDEGVTTPSGVNYQNLFYAIVDATYSALEKSGGSSLTIVVTESGWPSAGGDTTTVENARIYNSNLIEKVKDGTPKRPEQPIETYIFTTFDEDEKSPEYEKSFGIFTPDMQLKYPISFS